MDWTERAENCSIPAATWWSTSVAMVIWLATSVADGDGPQIIRDRYVASMIPTETREILDSAAEYARTQKPDGSWADVDYADRLTTYWKTMKHLQRALTLAKANHVKRDET